MQSPAALFLALLLAPFAMAQPPARLTDDRMAELALAAVTPEFPKAMIAPLRSKNIHLGEPWNLAHPLPDWRVFSITLRQGLAAPVRQYVAVNQAGEIVRSFTSEKFAALVAKTDRSKWTDQDYIDAACYHIHLTTTASQDGWKLLTKPADFTAITFNMAAVGPGVEKRNKVAQQIQAPTVARSAERKNPNAVVALHEWHLIGGILSQWQLTFTPQGIEATRKELGRFGGGGYD